LARHSTWTHRKRSARDTVARLQIDDLRNPSPSHAKLPSWRLPPPSRSAASPLQQKSDALAAPTVNEVRGRSVLPRACTTRLVCHPGTGLPTVVPGRARQDVLPAASMDGFTAARNDSWKSRIARPLCYISPAKTTHFHAISAEMPSKTAICSKGRAGRCISPVSLLTPCFYYCSNSPPKSSQWHHSRKTVASLVGNRCISPARALHLSAKMPIPPLHSITYPIPLYSPVITCKSFFARNPQTEEHDGRQIKRQGNVLNVCQSFIVILHI